jgi:hypothetical protein
MSSPDPHPKFVSNGRPCDELSERTVDKLSIPTTKKRRISGDDDSVRDHADEKQQQEEDDDDDNIHNVQSDKANTSSSISVSVPKRKKAKVVTFGGTDVRIIESPSTSSSSQSLDKLNIHDDKQSPVQFLEQVMKDCWDIDLDSVRQKVSSSAALAAAAAVASKKKAAAPAAAAPSFVEDGEDDNGGSDHDDDNDCFPYHVPTEEQLAGYTTRVVSAARNNDLDELKRIYYSQQQQQQQQDEDRTCRIDAISQFGESLLHLACRRGYTEMVTFLVETCQVPARVVDDFGRNPVHDACWNPMPQLQICRTLMNRDPMLFLQADKRGFTPFEYARPQHWSQWKKFLWEHRRCFFQLHHQLKFHMQTRQVRQQ